MEDLSELLAGHPFVSGMSAGHLALLAADVRRVRFAPGEVLGREGDEAWRFLLVLRGAVVIEALIPGRGQVGFQDAGAGDALGWSWLFPPFQWHFTARAAEEVEALEWDAARLRELSEQHPQLGFELSRRLTRLLLKRLQATHTQLIGFYGQG